jgi:hypothetical protein
MVWYVDVYVSSPRLVLLPLLLLLLPPLLRTTQCASLRIVIGGGCLRGWAPGLVETLLFRCYVRLSPSSSDLSVGRRRLHVKF